MVNLLFSTHGRISRGPFWLVYLILFPATLALILFIEASVNNNPVLTLIAFVLYFWIAICNTVKRLHDRCDRMAFDSCRFNSDCRNASRFFSWHHWPK